MSTPTDDLWQRYRDGTLAAAGITLDLSRLDLPDRFLSSLEAEIARAVRFMSDVESGRIANVDEGRRVGHYWLRAPELAPLPEIRKAIEETLEALHDFVRKVHSGAIASESGKPFRSVLVIGIGGSALGPQLVADALGSSADPMRVFFFDNTDPDGFDRVLRSIPSLEETLAIIVSKSGGTPETSNGMLEAAHAFAEAGLAFAKHAVAITMEGSSLHAKALAEGWLATFPMWDWVGGRTSELSAVGLLPALLEGLDAEGLRAGARELDAATRDPDPRKNAALLLALAWHKATGGRGEKDMVILPYKDRLVLLSRYLQQLIMESLGKELDLDGNVVHQGIAVYGNKGSTDQHSYVQQLRDGVHNFFVTFIEVLRDRDGPSAEVAPGLTSGDYLLGFLLGTRQALHDKGRESITITIEDLSARSLGAVIALYERAVTYYAGLVNINAYHQPGVAAGKVAAEAVVLLQRLALGALRGADRALTAEEVAASAREEIAREGLRHDWAVETIYKVLEHLAANRRGVVRHAGKDPCATRFAPSGGAGEG